VTSVPPTGAAPLDANATRARRFREAMRTRGTVYALVLGAAATVVAASAAHDPALAAGAPVWVAAVVAALAFRRADRRAEDDFFSAFAAGAGLAHYATWDLLPLTPLLGAGDRRRLEHWMSGPLGDGVTGALALYTYDTRERRRSAEGVGEQWEHHRFTVAVVDAEAALQRLPGVYLRPRRALVARLDGSGDWLSGHALREVELESERFCERYDLRTGAESDEIPVRALFAPSFVLWLAEHPLPLGFELSAGTLVVYVERRLEDAGHLAMLCEATAAIARRVAAEAPSPV
jgi:hypothetical protein